MKDIILTPTKLTVSRVVQLEPYHTETVTIEAEVILTADVDEAAAVAEGFNALRIMVNNQTLDIQRNWDNKQAGAW